MLKARFFTLAAAAALVSAPALAQTQSGQPAGTAAGSGAAQGSFLTQQQPNHWRADKMIGLTVYDSQNQNVGDIKEILLDRSGTAQAVVIGVGGFLGIGEKNVAVPFNMVQWKMESVRSTGVAGGTTGTTTGTGTTGTTATGSTATGTTASANMEYPNHAVISMTRQQLEAAPNFHYAS